MNSKYIIDNLVAEDIKVVEGIEFHQKRQFTDGYIVKDISFSINGELHEYQERVRAFTLSDFEKMFAQTDIHLLDVFGDYKLGNYDEYNSERLIMIFK